MVEGGMAPCAAQPGPVPVPVSAPILQWQTVATSICSFSFQKRQRGEKEESVEHWPQARSEMPRTLIFHTLLAVPPILKRQEQGGKNC